jgi:hypothetical protein
LQTADEFHGRQTAPKPAQDEGWIMKMSRRDVLAAGTTTAMMAIADSVPAVGAQSRAGGAKQTFDVIIIIVRGGSAGAVFGTCSIAEPSGIRRTRSYPLRQRLPLRPDAYQDISNAERDTINSGTAIALLDGLPRAKP